MHKIAVLDYRIQQDVQDKIQALAENMITFPENRCPESQTIERTGDADIALVTPWDKIDSAYLDACPNIKYIGLCGTSTANVDLEELSRRGIAFSNIVSSDKHAVAEFFFMQLVYLARGIGHYSWKEGQEIELVGKTIGIIGLGKVGQSMANLSLAYGMKASYYSPHRKQEWEDRGLIYQTKESLLADSEIIVLSSPTNVEVISASDFDHIKQGSILVQACSGSPFNKAKFVEWIAHEGNFALFDMPATEKNYQLYKDLPGVIFSRAVAGDTHESNQRRGQRILQNLQNYLDQSKQGAPKT